jgi:hypothetical protein
LPTGIQNTLLIQELGYILDFVSYSTSRCTETYLISAPHDVNITIIPQLDHAVFIRMLMDFALVSWSYPVDALVASRELYQWEIPNLLRLTPRPLFLIPVQAKAGSSESHLGA